MPARKEYDRETTVGAKTALPLIDIGLACERLQADRKNVDGWIREGKLQAFLLPPTAKTKGGKRFLVEAEVEAWAAARPRRGRKSEVPEVRE